MTTPIERMVVLENEFHQRQMADLADPPLVTDQGRIDCALARTKEMFRHRAALRRLTLPKPPTPI